MNQPPKTLSLLILFTFVCVSLSYAAPKTTTQDKDKYGYVPHATTGTPIKIQTSTTTPLPKVSGVARPLDPVEVTPTPPQTIDITPYRPVCSAFEEYKNEGAEIQAVDQGPGPQCPPGYHCEGYRGFGEGVGGCLYRCISDHRTTPIYADETACRWTLCTRFDC